MMEIILKNTGGIVVFTIESKEKQMEILDWCEEIFLNDDWFDAPMNRIFVYDSELPRLYKESRGFQRTFLEAHVYKTKFLEIRTTIFWL